MAIQWILGEYSITRDIGPILERAINPSSPLLEFSFRNSWEILDHEAKQALAVLSIFENPPAAAEWRTALDWSVELLDRSISSLMTATFVAERTDDQSGRLVYSALPITLTFARNQLSKMGHLESLARTRFQGYRNRLDLASVETAQYSDLFERFNAANESEKQAIILARMAEGQARALRYEGAAQYFSQAFDLDPRSVFAHVSYAEYKAEMGEYGEAIDHMKTAATHCNKKTGYFVHFTFAKIYDQIRDRENRAR